MKNYSPETQKQVDSVSSKSTMMNLKEIVGGIDDIIDNNPALSRMFSKQDDVDLDKVQHDYEIERDKEFINSL